MALSGIISFTQKKLDLILDALSLIGVNSVGKIPSPEDITLAGNILNKMIKSWQTIGLHLWTKDEGMLFLTPYVGKYDLGLSTTPFADVDGTVTAQLTQNQNLGDTILNVNSTTGMLVNDNIGVVQSNGFIYWSKISAIPSSTTVTLNSGLPSAIPQGQLVYDYTTQAHKPLRILDARVLQGIDLGYPLGTSQFETPLAIVPYQSFYEVGMVTNTSVLPNQATYIPSNTSGRLNIWPRPNDASKRIQITYERMVDDLTNVSDDFDFPSEWLLPLTYQLAILIPTPFGKEQKATYLQPLAGKMLQDLIEWDRETTNVTFQVAYDSGGYSSYNGGEGWGR